MPEYLTPGLYVEEVDSGSKPIEGVGTNTCAFIGYAKSGDFNKPTFISSWSQFVEIFGQDENRLLTALSETFDTKPADVMKGKIASRKGWMEFAQKTIEAAVRENESMGTKATGVGVKNFGEFLTKNAIPQTASPYIGGSYLAHSVFGYYLNGGARAYIVRVPYKTEDDGGVSVSTGAAAPVASAASKAVGPARAILGPMTFTAKDAGTASGEINVEVEPVGDGEFRLKINKGDQVEVWPTAEGKMKQGGVAAALRRSTLVEVKVAEEAWEVKPMKVALETMILPEPIAASGSVPAAGTANLPQLSAWSETGENALPLFASSLISDQESADMMGDEANRTGAGGLSTIDDVNMIVVPDLMAGAFRHEKIKMGATEVEGEEQVVLSDARRQAILDMQVNMVAYCEKMRDRQIILDPLPGLSAQEMRDITNNTPYGSEKGQAAIYYPWIKVTDPLRKNKQLFVPPGGHMAGVWARVGSERGVHKAPANEVVRGAVALENYLTKGDQAILNPDGINAIRIFPGEGIKVYGARTLATRGNPSWKYVNVRRLFNYLEKSIEKNMGWAVFEPNDPDLWGRLRRNISAFLFTEWKEGKLMGAVPQEAYYVKCDAETNPQEMVDLGRVYVEVGINPVKPAEFVIIRMGQWSGGASASEE